MNDKRPLFFSLLFLVFCRAVFASPLYSPTWGFSIDLPEDYEYAEGDNRDRFSFENPEGAKFDIIVYHSAPGAASPYASVEALARDINRRLNNRGELDSFEYRQKEAYIIELSFSTPVSGGGSVPMTGWALCLELGKNLPQTQERVSTGEGNGEQTAQPERRSFLLAMAYGQAGRPELQALHFSALDSIAPDISDMLVPGPITAYAYPRETAVQTPLFGLGISAWIFEEDAEAAQALIDREFQILRRYANAPNWKEAWSRFYRAIYRDSFDRLAHAAFEIERKINVPSMENRDFADQVLHWVQSFKYERDLLGSDFVNLVSAATEGRGDCDSRAMLWAIILKQANIASAMMVSREYGHAMGLADLSGQGARFELEGKEFLVAETTANVSVGLIGETVSEIDNWMGISFE